MPVIVEVEVRERKRAREVLHQVLEPEPRGPRKELRPVVRPLNRDHHLRRRHPAVAVVQLDRVGQRHRLRRRQIVEQRIRRRERPLHDTARVARILRHRRDLQKVPQHARPQKRQNVVLAAQRHPRHRRRMAHVAQVDVRERHLARHRARLERQRRVGPLLEPAARRRQHRRVVGAVHRHHHHLVDRAAPPVRHPNREPLLDAVPGTKMLGRRVRHRVRPRHLADRRARRRRPDRRNQNPAKRVAARRRHPRHRVPVAPVRIVEPERTRRLQARPNQIRRQILRHRTFKDSPDDGRTVVRAGNVDGDGGDDAGGAVGDGHVEAEDHELAVGEEVQRVIDQRVGPRDLPVAGPARRRDGADGEAVEEGLELRRVEAEAAVEVDEAAVGDRRGEGVAEIVVEELDQAVRRLGVGIGTVGIVCGLLDQAELGRGHDRRIVVALVLEEFLLVRLAGAELGVLEKVEEILLRVVVAGRGQELEVRARALRAAADHRERAVGTGGHVDAAGVEGGEQHLLRDLDVVDDEGRDAQGRIEDDDLGAVRLDEQEVGAVDADVVDRHVGRQPHDVVRIGAQLPGQASGRDGRSALRGGRGLRCRSVVRLGDDEVACLGFEHHRHVGKLRHRGIVFNGRETRIFNSHFATPSLRRQIKTQNHPRTTIA